MNVWIIGKGASLHNLKREQIGEGIIITINSAIVKVESLNLTNITYSLAKDGASPDYLNECPSMECSKCPWMNEYPEKAILLLHKHESIECMPDYYPRMIIDSEQYGLSWRQESVMLAIEFALYLGATNIIFVSFDAVTLGSDNGYMPDGRSFATGFYSVQAERLKERVQTLQHEFLTP